LGSILVGGEKMKKNILILVFSLYMGLFNLNQLFAQNVELEKIVITPSKIEQRYGEISRKVDLITSKEAEFSSMTDLDLAEILTNITSVNISNYGGLGATKTIRMRGSSAAQVLVMVDGRPINNPRDGEVELTTIPLEYIDRIEVIHGPASSLYGSSAMGGVVNIITKSPPEEGQRTEFMTSFGTYRTYLERLSHSAKINNFGYIITAEYQSSEGHRDNAEFNAKDFNSKFEYEFNPDNKLSLNSGFYRTKLGTPGEITSPDLDDKQHSLKNFLDLNWRLKPSTETNLLMKLYQNYDRLEFIENTAGFWWETAFKKDIHTTKVRGLELQFSQQLLDVYRWLGGFNYVENLNSSTTTGRHKYLIRAGYLDNQLDLFKNLTLNFGARLDDYSNFGTEICPSISFLYKFNKDAKLRGGIGRSFRAPTFNDLYWPFDGWSQGNPDLKPEKGITGEFGVEVKLNKYVTTDITYFRSDYDDLINWEPDSGGIWRPQNIDSAIIDGIELENNIYLMPRLELDLYYTWLRAKNDKTHNYLIYQPKHKFDFSLKYENLNGFIFELKGQFTDKRFYNADNTIKVKRFFILGIDVSKKIKDNFTFFISIDNLLDKKYQIMRNYPMPGFSITSGLKLEF
jgi:outer membrane receptor for ferrienterochelin and colicins